MSIGTVKSLCFLFAVSSVSKQTRAMSHHKSCGEEDDDELSTSESDHAFEEDMEALRKACMKTGADPNDLQITVKSDSSGGRDGGYAAPEGSDSDCGDELELLRSIQNRLGLSDEVSEPLLLKPLRTLPPVGSYDDDEDDDMETLRAIERRFSVYPATSDTWENSAEDCLKRMEQTYKPSIHSEDVTCNDLPSKVDSTTYLSSETAEMQPSSLTELHQADASKTSALPLKSSDFPKSAQMFIYAIKRNRSYQKFLRSKLTHIEAKIEENKQLRERVKILKDFQVSCRKITGRALSQGKDPRVQLISSRKPRISKDPEVNHKNADAMACGPPENSRVANYRMALSKFPLLQQKKWSRKETENLVKGIRHQFQERMFQVSLDWLSDSNSTCGDGRNLDDMLASIKDLDITPERIREFLPKVNWHQLASMYVPGRTGAECKARWCSHEDPLINFNPWTAEEDKNLLLIVQEKGITNWENIAVYLGTNRTPFQCLARYQRSLNASILKREWSDEEDEKLRIAVEEFGECDWQSVASALSGRTGTQCSNRWKKSLHPTRERVGRWTLDEDKRLKVAVMLFGPRNWKKIAEVVPGRTQVQCRERWVNVLDPSLKLGEWTEEEDSRLEVAIKEHGYCWSKVAACVPSRTDNQCWRRWKVLHPDQVPLLQKARKLRKSALISNFVDRESERPALGLDDFIPLLGTSSMCEPKNVNRPQMCRKKQRVRAKSEKQTETASKCENVNLRKKCKSKLRERLEPEKQNEAASCHVKEKSIPRRCSQKKRSKPHSESYSCEGPVQENSNSLLPSTCLITRDDDREAESFGSSPVLRASRRPPRRKILTKLGEEQSSMCSENSVLSGGTEGSEVMHDHSSCVNSPSITTNCEEAGVLAEDCASRDKRASSQPQRNIYMDPSHPQSSTITNAEVVENFLSHRDIYNNGSRALRQGRKSRYGDELSREDDDLTLSCFLGNKSLKRRKGAEPSKDEALLHTRSKKRKLQTNENTDSTVADKENVKLASFIGRKHKKRSHQVQTIRTSDKEISKLDMINDDSPHELAREQGSISQNADLEADSITLAFFLSELKKRRPKIPNDANTATSSPLARDSELQYSQREQGAETDSCSPPPGFERVVI